MKRSGEEQHKKSYVFAVKANYLVICRKGQIYTAVYRLTIYTYSDSELFRTNKNTSSWRYSGKHVSGNFEKVASGFFPSSFIIKAFMFVSSPDVCFASRDTSC